MFAATLAALTIALSHQPAPSVAGHRITSYQSAVRAFGTPTRIFRSCDALWSRIAHDVEVVGDDPRRLRLARDRARQQALVLLQTRVNLVPDARRLPRVVPGGD